MRDSARLGEEAPFPFLASFVRPGAFADSDFEAHVAAIRDSEKAAVLTPLDEDFRISFMNSRPGSAFGESSGPAKQKRDQQRRSAHWRLWLFIALFVIVAAAVVIGVLAGTHNLNNAVSAAALGTYPGSFQNNGTVTQLQSYSSVLGNVSFVSNAGTTMSISGLTYVGLNIIIANNSVLVLVNFPALTYVAGYVTITENAALTASKFASLTFVGGFVQFDSNALLAQISTPVLLTIECSSDADCTLATGPVVSLCRNTPQLSYSTQLLGAAQFLPCSINCTASACCLLVTFLYSLVSHGFCRWHSNHWMCFVQRQLQMRHMRCLQPAVPCCRRRPLLALYVNWQLIQHRD